MSTERYNWWILAVIVFCSLPHLAYLAPWVPITCLFMWIYAGGNARYGWPRPPGKMLKVVTGIVFLGAMGTHEGMTIEAFVALLILTTTLKLMEIKSKRDQMITVILCYFIIAGGFLVKDSIGATLYIMLSILLTTAALIHVNRSISGAGRALRISGILMVQALPVTIVLFMFFPRIQGGMWGRTHLNSARTGFNDKVVFGSIAELAQNTEVAFRVEFIGEIPQQDQLYWKGAVLWKFDGESWSRGMTRQTAFTPRSESESLKHYTIALEPHNKHWIFTLDRPVQIDLRWARFLPDYSVYRWRPITSRVSYAAQSDLFPQIGKLSIGQKQQGLQLPTDGNPRSRILANRLRAETTDQAYVDKVLEYFRQQPFYYTLNPPQLNSSDNGEENDLIDRFLFESRRGFCEHFAGAFAFLMRAAGLPTRVVVGYLGGSPNRYGGYLVVRQSEAHAWCEVWLSERGWVRVDPTTVVAPDRVQGVGSGAGSFQGTETLMSFLENRALGQWLGAFDGLWDYLNTYWNRWVMAYSINEQVGLFSRLGVKITPGENKGKHFLVVFMASMVVVVGISLLILREVKADSDEATDLWLSFCDKLSRVGLRRHPSQGPLDYLGYVCAKKPELEGQVRDIIMAYVKIRYGNSADATDILFLKKSIKKFSPEKQRKIKIKE